MVGMGRRGVGIISLRGLFQDRGKAGWVTSTRCGLDATAAAMALAMSRSGDTVSAPATESAVFGMPYTVDVASSWITAQAPARRIARHHSLPSLPITVR